MAPVYLRKIKYSKWPKDDDDKVMAAALKDIGTRDAALSVWMADAEIGMDRMIAAIAASGTSVTQFDYVLLDSNWLDSRGYSLANTPDHGRTPDKYVNQLHFDLHGLTAFELYDLALHMSSLTRGERRPIVRDRVANLIKEHKDLCHIDERCLNEKLRRSLCRILKKRKQCK